MQGLNSDEDLAWKKKIVNSNHCNSSHVSDAAPQTLFLLTLMGESWPSWCEGTFVIAISIIKEMEKRVPVPKGFLM